MTKNALNSQRGGATLTILLVILCVVIVALIYFLGGGTSNRIGKTHGTDTPANVSTTPDDGGVDGLGTADEIQTFPLDEFGAGISKTEIFNRDINGDGQMDKITRTHHENGTAHSYDEYKIELNNNGKMVDITPDGFRTVIGTECALQQLHFTLRPDFGVVKISRPWDTSWTTPTMAVKTIYNISDNKLNVTESHDMRVVCDVAELF